MDNTHSPDTKNAELKLQPQMVAMLAMLQKTCRQQTEPGRESSSVCSRYNYYIFCLFKLMLNAPVNSFGHVGTLSAFYGTCN